MPAIYRLAPGPEEEEKGKKMSDYIDKSSLYKSIADREKEYRSALLKEKNYNTPSAWLLQGLLSATTLIKHFVFDYPTVDAEPGVWIPISARPMDTKERLEWSEKLGYDIGDDEALLYTSQLPDDGQEVLVCGRSGRAWVDTFNYDPDGRCYFEENGDMDGIVAWMPLPKPYRERKCKG